ncbi:MAG: helix-turn-helix transcriptional regulator [Actinomycetia bacterium]|nr:helix-turn-helix transcriptional regulator [Actinomycetes bacterium]
MRFIDAAAGRVGAARGVVLAGAAGVGKTRLARETLTTAAQRGAVTRWVAATASARGLPLGAFGTLMGTVGGDPARILRQASDALLAGAGPAGVVIGVDDAHLLDELSALLVHRLVLSAAVTVVVTVRSGESTPDAVTALWKDGHLDRLEVQPLSGPETAALLEAVLGGPVDSAGLDRMWALTRGNALFLRQLVEGELEAGRLRAVDGLWRWSGQPVVSPGLAELVEARMGGLTEPLREVVDVLALGEPLGVSLLARLTDAAAVESAEARGLVSVERDGRRLNARLAHPLYGEVRRADVGLLRSRRLRGRIAVAAGETGGRRAEDALRRAVLAVDSDLAPDPELLTAAARTAVELLDLALAERLARAAAAAGGGFDAQLLFSCVLSWISRGAEADIELSAVAELAGNDAQRTQAAVPRAANLFWTLRRPAEAEAVLDSAEGIVIDVDARLVLTAVRAAFHAGRGRPLQAIEAARTALDCATLPDQAVVLATWGLVAGLGVVGQADEVGPAVSRAYLATAQSIDAAVLRFGLSDFHVDALRLAGYVHEAESVALDRREESSNVPGPLQLFGVGLLGRAALASGRLRTAVRWLREARVGLATFDTVGWLFRYLLSLTQALAMTGDAVVARQTLAEMEAQRHPAFVFLDPEVVLARAWVAAAQGAVSEAITLAHEAAAVAVGRGQLAHEMLALHTAVCFGDRTVAARLAELAGHLDGPRAPAAAAHAAALATDDGDALQAASARFEEMGDLLAAADAAAHAAAAYMRHDRPGPTRAAAARAHRLGEACEGARTPALVAAARPLPLTEREREIVTLAAQGLSNREIAERLIVSVRTIEGHLYRASAKLGITNRAELAAILRGD